MNTNLVASMGLKIASGLTALALAAGFLFAPSATAFAEDGTPPAPQGKGEKAGGKIDELLRKALEREQERLGLQQERLNKAPDVVAKIQGFIDTQKAKGVDTSAAEAALATFQAQIAQAQAAHDTAASILNAHAGFDDKGKVTDREQAKVTVQSARQALRSAGETLRQAGQDLRAAVRAWREAHKPAEGEAAPITVP